MAWVFAIGRNALIDGHRRTRGEVLLRTAEDSAVAVDSVSVPTGGGGPVRRGVHHCVRVVRRAPKRFSLGAVVGGLALTYLIRRYGATGEGTEASLLVGAPLDPFCASGLQPVAGGACYAAPHDAPPDSPLPLVIYLHGLFEKGPMEDEERDRQRRVARQATARGFAVLALRGAERLSRLAGDGQELAGDLRKLAVDVRERVGER
jgi:hypothetical protein